MRKERLTARNGSLYLSLRLRDRTGTLAGAGLPRGRPDRACASSAATRSPCAARSSASAASWSPSSTTSAGSSPASFDPAEFLPAAYRSAEELEGFLEHLAREIHDPGLRAVVERGRVFAARWPADFRRAPCTRAGHHAYLGGLLEHTVAVATLVGELCQLHPRLDSDLLMAAAILHDVGRAREFTYGAEFGISDEGRMLGHLAIGAEIVGAAAGVAAPTSAGWRCSTACSPTTGPTPARRARARRAGAAGFASAEALALYRLNALDASVKGALEHG